jgi:DNA-binding GntR family transcriptional regulator
MAAARRTDEHLAQLEHLLVADHAHRERGASFAVNRDFHKVVLAAAQNALIELMTEPVFGILQGRLLHPGLDVPAWEAVSADHHLVADRIAAGDVVGAEDAMRDHLRRIRQFYVA